MTEIYMWKHLTLFLHQDLITSTDPFGQTKLCRVVCTLCHISRQPSVWRHQSTRCFTWISFITQTLRQWLKQHVATVCTQHCGKITAGALDINTFPPAVGPPSYSSVCLFSLWSPTLCCAKVAFVCDGPAEQLSWVWSAGIQEEGLLSNPLVINGDT